MSISIKNKKASFEYFLLEQIEAGIVLAGSEVKAIRFGRANLKDSFCKIINHEVFIFQMHITHLESANIYFKPDEKRARKLLLHKSQINKLKGKMSVDGLSLIPLHLYFNKKGKAKILISLAKGKKLYDKREAIKTRELELEARASIKNYLR